MTTQTQLTIKSDDLINCITQQKEDGFLVLTEITAVDYIQQRDVLQLIYILTDIKQNRRLIINTDLSASIGQKIDSLCKLYPCASWLEREIYDMFGIQFTDHPNLQRILTEYDCQDHPLRKDYPLYGHHEVYYDIDLEKINKRPVRLPIEYRNLNTQSPWHGPEKSKQ